MCSTPGPSLLFLQGLDQVNLQIDASLRGRGVVPIAVSVDGVAANGLTVAIVRARNPFGRATFCIGSRGREEVDSVAPDVPPPMRSEFFHTKREDEVLMRCLSTRSPPSAQTNPSA